MSGMSPQELERVYDEHAGAMYRHGMAMLGQEAAVRDVLQDIFLKLSAQAEGGSQGGGVPEQERAYLLRMVHHAAIDLMRRAKVRSEHAAKESAAAEGMAPGIFQRGADPDREAYRQRLQEALGCLPVDQREVVVLKLWEERTFIEIAEICGIPANTAASKYRYGLEKLRGLLRPLYEEL